MDVDTHSAAHVESRVTALEARVSAVEESVQGVSTALEKHTADSKDRTDAILVAVADVKSAYAQTSTQLLTLVGETVKASIGSRVEIAKATEATQTSRWAAIAPGVTPIASAIAAAVGTAVAAWVASRGGQ